jgi:LysM repeat protein
VAEKAGKAAPAVAIAGALVAAPQAQHAAAATAKPDATAAAGVHKPSAPSAPTAPGATATLEEFRTHTITVATASTARHAAAKNTYYKVRSGDTLSGIAEHYYHRANDWQWLYHENAKTVSNPDLIYPGQTLLVPAHVPANYTLAGYVPRHAKPAEPPPPTTSSADTDHDGASGGGTTRSAAAGGSGGSGGSGGRSSHHSSSGWGSSGGGSGTLGCSGLERLWEAAGGSPAHAFIAAEIAMAESGGNQYAHSPTNDFGYWQINGSNGALATYDAFGNARSAIILSQNGTNWSPWTTYTSGAYAGRC